MSLCAEKVFCLTRLRKQPILDLLAEMIAYDPSLRLEGMASAGGVPGMPNLANLSDMPNVGLD